MYKTNISDNWNIHLLIRMYYLRSSLDVALSAVFKKPFSKIYNHHEDSLFIQIHITFFPQSTSIARVHTFSNAFLNFTSIKQTTHIVWHIRTGIQWIFDIEISIEEYKFLPRKEERKINTIVVYKYNFWHHHHIRK